MAPQDIDPDHRPWLHLLLDDEAPPGLGDPVLTPGFPGTPSILHYVIFPEGISNFRAFVALPCGTTE